MTITAANYDLWNATQQGYDDLPATLEELLDRPAWMADALCREHTDVSYFPEHGQQSTARQVCAACSVRAECLEFAIVNECDDGYWGGTSARERVRIRHQRHAAA